MEYWRPNILGKWRNKIVSTDDQWTETDIELLYQV